MTWTFCSDFLNVLPTDTLSGNCQSNSRDIVRKTDNMRIMQIKKSAGVGTVLMLLFLISLPVVTKLFSRNATLKTTSAPRTHRLRYGRIEDLLRGGPKAGTQVLMENTFKSQPVAKHTKTSNKITLAVVEEHHEGK